MKETMKKKLLKVVWLALMAAGMAVVGRAEMAARTGGGRNAQYVAPEELKARAVWVEQNLLDRPTGGKVPFSFTYDGRPAARRLQDWKRESTSLDRNRMEHLLTWTDSRTGLVVQCRAVEYSDYPTVEWTLSFENTGEAATPIIENIRALAVKFERAKSEEFVLHYQNGDDCSPQSYGVHEARLEAGARRDFAPNGGWPTSGAYPYFNIEFDGGGVIAVVGWPGQWAAWFERDQTNGLRVSGGQQLTRFKLLPGEKVRSPLVLLQFWTGDWVRSQNVWRRWMIAHNMPRPGGQLPQPFTSTLMGLNQSAKGEIGFIDAFVKAGIDFDYWWMSAGWYPMTKDWWEVGTWEPDPVRFPNGIREVSDHVHANKMKLVLWFEPERVHPGSWLYTNHPEWLLSKGDGDKLIKDQWLTAHGGDVDKLLNLGDPAARQWLIDHIDNFLTKQGIDLYQQDFNFDPLDYWRNTDAPDRQGITENQYVQGYLAYWDELRRRRPGMLIDSCASGGRRNDLETLRRAGPLLRSDFNQPNDLVLPESLYLSEENVV
jgi:alpha-galactosidase